MAFELPPKSQVGVLDPEIAGEGQKVINSEGEQLNWSPPPPRPVMPDWSEIKSIRKYFNRTGHQVWPAWLYHPTEQDRLVKSAEEAAQLGVYYRKATDDEGAQFGVNFVWQWEKNSWRPKPYRLQPFNPLNAGTGKHVIIAAAQVPSAQAMIAEMMPQVGAAIAAALAQALKAHGDAPASSLDPGKIAVAAVTEVAASSLGEEGAANALTSEEGLGEDEELEIWRAEAERKGIKVDRRWKIGRLKAEIEKAA